VLSAETEKSSEPLNRGVTTGTAVAVPVASGKRGGL